METDVAVLGAGSSGLAAMKALRERGLDVQGFERGSDVGGLWRYKNDSGLSAAYASLRTNVSRKRMEYPSFAMPKSYGDFPNHSEMAAYLDAYADSFGVRDSIRFRTTVERLEPATDGRWRTTLDDGSRHSYGAVVVATGPFSSPRLPNYPGSFVGTVTHSHEYRTPEPYAGRRVLVVGAGQSAAEIAVEVSAVAARTFMSVRRGVHMIPRWIGRRPYDAADVAPLNRLPWGLLNMIYGLRVSRALGPHPASWPLPADRPLEGIPIVSSDLLAAVRRADVVVKPAIDRLAGTRVRFVDGSEERVDRIVYATGYRIGLPYLPSSLLSAAGRELPLYRRIAPPKLRGLYFAGFVDAPGGLLPVVETQGRWIAAVVTGQLCLPARERMWQAIEQAEPRTRERFPDESPRSVRCDPHAYRRLLHADLRRARRRVWRAATAAGSRRGVAEAPVRYTRGTANGVPTFREPLGPAHRSLHRQMRLPDSAHTSRPWRIHELTRDFRLEDVWALPTPGGPDDFARLVQLIASGDPSQRPSRAAGALWAIRWKVGKLLGWDGPDAGLGSRVPTLRERLPADLRDAPSGPDVPKLPFTSLYLIDDEWAAEIANRTMHGVMHLGWVPDGSGGYCGQMAVLVKPDGLVGASYMAAIRPFRHLIVYPPMLREIGRRWRSQGGARA